MLVISYMFIASGLAISVGRLGTIFLDQVCQNRVQSSLDKDRQNELKSSAGQQSVT